MTIVGREVGHLVANGLERADARLRTPKVCPGEDVRACEILPGDGRKACGQKKQEGESMGSRVRARGGIRRSQGLTRAE